jgi:hypothetical protein
MPTKNYVYIPDPKFGRLVQLADAQGVKPPAFVARLITMYEKDPAAYEQLFQKVLRPPEQRPPT